ncbi:hypothetical protein WISP_96941 [Willisornis vidua]|uniref:SFI1 protein n=1 Tax=Willisornis vidua TaxID=1566151 RepID=A0ABQ9CZL5_9PASS|nr:hypothetical protein WISP_96941 [Willisornis vidua]
MNVGVAMYGTPGEVCVRVTSPPGDKEFRPGQQLSVKSVEVSDSEPRAKCSKESGDVCDSRSEAARMAVVGSSQSSPLGVQGEEGFGECSGVDCTNGSREGRRNKHSHHSSWRTLEADANLNHAEEHSVERSAREPRCCEEGSQSEGTVSREVSENSLWSLKVKEQRCFSVWKENVEQKALDRCNLAHLRAVSLRKHFQLWVEMLQVREGDKQAVVNLFFLRWRQHHGADTSSEADKIVTKRSEGQSLWTVEREFLGKTGCSFDDFCQKLKLQRVYLLWKARLCEHHKADSFSQTLEQCRLRKALKLWHQKYLMLKTIEQSSKHSDIAVYEEPLTMLFSEDLSTSSGFDSSAPATLTSQSSLEKLHQCPELPAELGGDLCLHTSFPPQSPGAGRNWFVGDQFQSLVLQSPESDAQILTSYSAWEEDCSSDKEVKSCWQQAEKWCLQRYFVVWSARTQQLVKAQQHFRHIQLSRCLVTWAQVTARRRRQHEALSDFQRVREHRVLFVSFTEWRSKLLRAEQQVPGERKHKGQDPCAGKACLRWRVAARGQQALRLGSVATVRQACNYWTKAAAFSQCLRQRSTLIGARKSRKMALSWSLRPAAADRKGLEGVETKVFAKPCGAEFFGGGSQEPPGSGLWKVAAAHGIPAPGQRTLLNGGDCLQLLLIAAPEEDTAPVTTKSWACAVERECCAPVMKAGLQASRMTAQGQPGREGT